MKNNANVWRAVIGILLGILVLFGAKKFGDRIVANKKRPATRTESTVNKVYTQQVQNAEIPITLMEKGSLRALQKVDLYAEVQGVLLPGNRLFKPGRYYSKGSPIFSIDDGEFKASLTSQKSVLYNLITQALPDLKLDYGDAFANWQGYLTNFDIQGGLTPSLPDFISNKEKYFINSKNIVTTYYNIKNLEERHKKYTISAPFNAIVTESLVDPGTLIRPGQKLGTILNPSAYELPLSINESYKDYLTIGKKVKLHNLNRTESWSGKIARINATINPQTQGIQTYVEVYGQGLKEGMFLEAELEGKSISKGFEIPRKLLINNERLYVVEENELKLKDVAVAFFKERTAVVTGLEDGTIILQNAVPGAYDGMAVESINDVSTEK